MRITPREQARRDGIPESQLQYYPDSLDSSEQEEFKDAHQEQPRPKLAAVPAQFEATIVEDPAEPDLFSMRPILQHIKTSAQALMAAPWSVLGIVLSEALAATEPGFRGPAIVGGELVPNLGMIIVGKSGQGKGASEKAARRSVHFATTQKGDLGRIFTEQFPLGTGEGIVASYRATPSDPEDPNERNRAIFSAPEIDVLGALSQRSGATIDSVLRQMLVGETLGFSNATKDRRTLLREGSYRAVMIIGAQPVRCDSLLNAADGGLPQRFVWLSAIDVTTPEVTPSVPAPHRVVLPPETRQDYIFKVPREAVEAIRTHRRRVLRGDKGVDPLDGHKMATQIKVAVALALLEGRADVELSDWELAHMVMAESSKVRAEIQTVLADRRRAANRAKALDRADADDIVEQHTNDRKRKRAINGILRKLQRDGETTYPNLKRHLKADLREFLHEALVELDEGGAIVTDGNMYWLRQ